MMFLISIMLFITAIAAVGPSSGVDILGIALAGAAGVVMAGAIFQPRLKAAAEIFASFAKELK